MRRWRIKRAAAGAVAAGADERAACKPREDLCHPPTRRGSTALVARDGVEGVVRRGCGRIGQSLAVANETGNTFDHIDGKPYNILD